MLGNILLGIGACDASNFTSGSWMQGVICPFQQTLGPVFVIFVGVTVFAGLAIYTRSMTIPAIVSILLVGMLAPVLPVLGAWLLMRYVVIVAAVLLFLLYLAVKG
ncbi:hypothetical protein A4G99_03810 [Haladaptatus sp. R4]|uniref:hypothetical protein n=1 Tax=Haladaptatus sp. R4 TaxID=1679489 RepID=UPI0007B46093|nr:hypothetical protein [Haladaptatus sp. R4]KZN25606.1 hypothetical protein A4G99_03810 [Haladaptatus sp. R4]